MASLTRAMYRMIYEIIVFEYLRFQKPHSGDRFRKPGFLVPENAAYLWMQISVFKFFKTSGCLSTEHFFFFEITVLLTHVIWFWFRQTRICTTWPSFSFTCLLRFIISSHNLEVSSNLLSIRIVLNCFYLLIFHFKKFLTWIWRLSSAVYV